MLHLHLSNRPAILADRLVTTLRTAPLPLLETEWIVVPSSAMARWLEFALADRLGITAQCAFPFPAAFAWQLFSRVLPEVGTTSPFERAALQWRFLRLLQTQAAPEIRHYLVGEDGSMSHGLALRLAMIFDRYLVDRPDWLAAWQQRQRVGLGADEAWQASLWRQLLDELPAVAGEHPRTQFLARLADAPGLRTRLPRRISLFAVETMPALYWETFLALADWLELDVYALSPSREYWGDIVRRRTQLRLALTHPEAAEAFEVGHPLLASLGRVRQSAFLRLADAGGEETADYDEPAESLLGTLQRDMLDLRVSRGCIPDGSLQVHACHGALREAEVLRDRLLALFEARQDMRPADVIVLTPDIETYGPLVAAVLMHSESAGRLPCVIADRVEVTLPMWRSLRQWCDVATGELDAESLLALLETPMLRRAFALVADDLPLLRDWVRDAGIRRGAGLPLGSAAAGAPAFDHSWRAGLQRLLLGAMVPDEVTLCRDIAPVTGVEGSQAAVLGRFADFVETVFEYAEKLGTARTAFDWTVLLGELLERCYLPDEDEEVQRQRLRQVLADLARMAGEADCQVKLPLVVILREIETALAERVPPRAFMSGKLTIAALQPGRLLSARVVCLVGMNDGAWPRPAVPLAFDLLSRHPRAGDRNRREEERQAFLDAVLSPTDALIVTYSGRDPRSNADLPPASPLAELLDTLAEMTGRAVIDLVIAHPLQPFSPRYFDDSDPRHFSFDASACPPRQPSAPAPFINASGLRECLNAYEVNIYDLKNFFTHPVRYFLRERMGIHLEPGEAMLETTEPFVADGLTAYQLREACFAARQAGETAGETLRRLRAAGALPHGVAGELAFDEASRSVAALWEGMQDWLVEPVLPPVGVEMNAAGICLTGQLAGVTARGLWRVRHGRLRAVDRLGLWLEHLLLQCAAGTAVGRHSVLFARDSVLELAPCSEAAAHLADLLALYRQGQQAPLPFYPETAWAWIEQKSGWRATWLGNSFQQRRGEADDPYVRLALRDTTADPLGTAFQQIAQRIYGPLREAMQ